jgi:hypothetical protein
MHRLAHRTLTISVLCSLLAACGSSDKTSSPTDTGGSAQGGTGSVKDTPGSFSVQVDVQTSDQATATWNIHVTYHATNADGTPSTTNLSSSALDDLKMGVSGYAKAYAALHTSAEVQDLGKVADGIKGAINVALQSGHNAVVDSIDITANG